MGWGSLLAIYFVVWWIMLFAVLPFGVTSQTEVNDISPGTDPGAPVAPKLLAKALWTSAIAAVATAIIAPLAPLLLD